MTFLHFSVILLVLDAASCWTATWRQVITKVSVHIGSGHWVSPRGGAGMLQMTLADVYTDTAGSSPQSSSSLENEADVTRYLRLVTQNPGRGGESKTRTTWSSLERRKRSSIQSILSEVIFQKEATGAEKEEKSLKVKSREAEAKLQTFSEAIYMLGKLRANPHTLDASFLSGMWDYFHLSNQATLNKYVGKILYSVASMGVRWKDIPPKTRKVFVSSFTQQLGVMSELAVVNLVYSLGKMGTGWHQLPVQSRNGICINIVRVSHVMDSRAVANVFWGLGQTKARWSTLPDYLQDCLSEKLKDTSPLGAQALSSTLNGLKNANGQWRYLQTDLRSTILANMRSSLRSGASEQAVATIIGSLGAMNLGYEELDADIRESVDVAISRASPHFTREGLSSTFHGLARMRWTAHNLSPSMLNSLESALRRVVETSQKDKSTPSSARFLASLMWSLGQLEMMWHRGLAEEYEGQGSESSDFHLLYSRRIFLGNHTMELLSSTVEDNAVLMNEQGIFSTLSGFAKMQAQWHSLGTPLTNALTSSLRANVPHMHTKAVCHTLWALGCVGLKWNDLAEIGLQDAMVNATIRVSGKLNTQGVSIALYSLAALECKYDSLPFALKVAIQGAIMRNSEKANGREVAIVLYSLGRMDANMNKSFSKKARRTMLDSMESTVETMDGQNLGNAIWGLFGKMQVLYSSTSPTFRRKVTKAIVGKQDSLNNKSLMSILHGFSRPGAERWESLDPQVQICLLYITERVFSKLEKQSYDLHLLAGNVLYAFGRLGVPWEGFAALSDDEDDSIRMTFTLQNILLHNLVIRKGVSSGPFIEIERSRAISFGLNGLAQMNTWSAMVDTQQELVLQAVRVAVPTLLPVDVANVMWSLGRLGVPTSDVPSETLEMLFQSVRDTVIDMKPFELVWTLWALNRMQVTFPSTAASAEDLYETLVRVVAKAIPSMTMQEMGVMMFSMTSMRVNMNEPSLVEEIFTRLERI